MWVAGRRGRNGFTRRVRLQNIGEALKATYDARTDTLSIVLNADASVAESDDGKPGVVLD
jgi:uncharacterized protein DUF2283